MRATTAAILAVGVALLVGCEITGPPPVIVDLEADKVVVQAANWHAEAAIIEKAAEGCALHRRTPRYLSEREVCGSTQCITVGTNTSCYPTDCVVHALFACLR